MARKPSTKPTRKRQQPSAPTEALRLSDVAPEQPRFLADPYVPLGALTLLEGDPGSGKSYVAADLGAAVSCGRWFDLQPLPTGLGGPPGRKGRAVLYVTSEDRPATLRERFLAQGADLDQVLVLREPLTVRDLSPLVRLVELHCPALVVIDPIHALLEGVTLASANAVRVALAPLATLAQDRDLSLLAIRHLAKAGGGKAIYRGLGSIDFSAIARSVLRVGEDPDRPGNRVLVHVKNSLGPLGSSVEFEIGERLEWLGRCELSSRDLDARPRQGRGRSAVDIAADYVCELLSAGPRPATEVRQAALAAGISERTLERAQKELGVVHLRLDDGKRRKGGGEWTWQLPAGTSPAGRLNDSSQEGL